MFVGLFKRFHGRADRAAPGEAVADGRTIMLHGRESFAFEVAGCGRRQAEIRTIMEAIPHAGRRERRLATIVPDIPGCDGAPQVSVLLGDVLVGHFPRYLSTQYREWLQAWRLGLVRAHCQALIVPDAARQEFRVKLDLEIPFKMTAIYE